MAKNTITILHLYPNDMNIYGDYGNVLTLKRRLEWQDFNVQIIEYNQGDKFPDNIDIVIGGGGQNSGQNKIKNDLLKIKPKLTDLAEKGTPMLVVCGLYQLFGKSLSLNDGTTISGVGIFDAKTSTNSKRLIGNILTHNEQFGDIIGYENHSGQTKLGPNCKPFGIVKCGSGNNSIDDTEGAIYKNVIGTYIHGSLLPKNPAIADFIIKKAVTKKYGEFNEGVIDDYFADMARKIAAKRPR